MEHQHQRLQQARTRAGYSNASEAARFFGWNENTYRSHENGERGLKTPVAAKYAKAFDVDPGWLITGFGDAGPRFSSGVEIKGLIGAKGIIQSTFDREQFSVRSIPFIPIFDVSAYIVLTAGLSHYEFGDLVLTTYDLPTEMKRYYAVVYYPDGRGRFGEVIHSDKSNRLLLLAGELIQFDEGITVRIEPVQIVVPSGFHSLRQPLPDLMD